MAQTVFTILLVDDNQGNRQTYREYLNQSSDHSYRILEADLGEVGLTLCYDASPDVVLLDHQLPDQTALEFLRALSAQLGEQMPALIVMTGRGNEEIAADVLKAGAEDYLLKEHVTASSLHHSLAQALEKSQLRQQLRESKERLRLALAAAHMGTWEWRFPSNELFCSEQVNTLFGLSPNKPPVSHDVLFERMHPGDRQPIQQAVKQAFRSSTQCDVEFRVIWPDGSLHWLNGKGQFYPGFTPQSGRMLGTVSDITRSKAAALERYQALQSEKLVMQIAQSVRKSLDLSHILQTTVAEVRHFLQTDRVLIFRLETPSQGKVIAESVGAEWEALLHSPFHDPCLTSDYIHRYRKGAARAIANIQTAGLAPCYVEFLKPMQVKACLVVPIFREETLWALLIVHQCSEVRQWQSADLSLIEQLAAQVSVAVRQAELYQQAQQEIRERQQVEASLRDSEARLRRAIVEAPFPIFIHAEDGRILQMSRVVSEMTGYDVGELQTIGDWTERIYGERQKPIAAGINNLYRLNKRIDEGAFSVRTKDGTSKTWLFSSAPLGCLNDGTRLVISMAADVTQQRQIEAALSDRLKQQAVLAQLSQTALSGMSLSAFFDRVVHLVTGSLKVTHCKILECLPASGDLLVRAGVGWQTALMGQAVVSGDRSSHAGYTLLAEEPIVFADLPTENRFQGSSMLIDHDIVSGISTTIPGQGGPPFGVLGAYSTHPQTFTQDDINFLQAVANLLATAIDRKQSEQVLQDLNLTLEQRVHERTQDLENANRDLEAFSYSVAHDLRAPLRAIQGFAQVLEEDCSACLDQLGIEYLHRMAASAEHLDALIQDLLTYSQLGRSEIHLQRINVHTVVKEILNSLDPALRNSASIELATDLPSVQAHRGILGQVFSNLIVNALKFVAPDVLPQIRIWAETQLSANGDRGSQKAPSPKPPIRIWVEDNGIGIAPQYHQRIFSPFERLHGADTYVGTGIGLSIVERGVARMGGRVGVESDIDQGSRFWIELNPA